MLKLSSCAHEIREGEIIKVSTESQIFNAFEADGRVRRNDNDYTFSRFAGIQRCLENTGAGQGMSAQKNAGEALRRNRLVETMGIEPTTSGLQSPRSPN